MGMFWTSRLRNILGKYWYQWGDNFGIYPTPTEVKTVRLHYVKKPLTITDTAVTDVSVTTPEINELLHDALVYYAVAEIGLRVGLKSAPDYRVRYTEELEEFLQSHKIGYPEKVKTIYRDV